MPNKTNQPLRYKICTENCNYYGYFGKNSCEKGNWKFHPPLERTCSFSLLEDEMELAQSSASCTESNLIDFTTVLKKEENTRRKESYERIAHLTDHLFPEK